MTANPSDSQEKLGSEKSKENLKEKSKESLKEKSKESLKEASKHSLKDSSVVNASEYKFKSCKTDSELKKIILEVHNKHKDSPTLPSMVEAIKKDLDSRIPKGWVVFAGKHMAGACSYIQGTMIDFEYDSTAFVIFQTFCPE